MTAFKYSAKPCKACGEFKKYVSTGGYMSTTPVKAHHATFDTIPVDYDLERTKTLSGQSSGLREVYDDRR